MLCTAACSTVEGVRKVGSLVPSCHPRPDQRASGQDTGPIGWEAALQSRGRFVPGCGLCNQDEILSWGNPGCFHLGLAPWSGPGIIPKRTAPPVHRLSTVLGMLLLTW